MIETTETVVDVTERFKCLKAEQRDADVLILRKLDAPIQRADGETAEYELEWRWLSNPRHVCCVQGNEFSFWRPRGDRRLGEQEPVRRVSAVPVEPRESGADRPIRAPDKKRQQGETTMAPP